MSKLRISIVEFLNTAPLVWGFTDGPLEGRYDLSFTVPSLCADALRSGQADIAIIPAIEYQRMEGMVVLPEIAIAAKGEVRSLLVLAKKPIEFAKRIALDTNSRSSVALTRLLCRGLWGIAPEFIDAPPDPEAMLATADAALVIGDPALRVRLKVDALSAKQPAGHGCCGGDESEHPVAGVDMLFVYDVAQQWREMTGKPSVLAVWAGRRDVVTPEVVADFLASREYGLANLGDIAEGAALKLELPPNPLERYLRESIDFSLDAENLAALEYYFARCADAGLIPAVRPIEFAVAPQSAILGAPGEIDGKDETMRMTPQEALDLFHSDDLVGIGMAAHQLRKKKTDPRVATYQIDRNINYTNFCTEYCSFCAFYRPMGAKDGYVLSFDTIAEKIEETIALGGTGILMQGGLNPDLPLAYYEDLLRSIKQRFPRLHLHCFSAPEILCIADVCGLSVKDTIARLRDAGLDSIPGGGAEILDDEIRARISRLKCRADEWEQMHRDAHSLGLRTTATMMFGCGEEFRHRVNHLERIRRIQDETGGFTAFIPWIFAPENTSLGKRVPEATAVDYLKTLAISRLYLDNFDHIQSSWLTPGIKVCQVGLQFGADDVGSILIEENVVYAAGVRNRTNEEELRRIISEAGYIPAQRDTLYRSYVWKQPQGAQPGALPEPALAQ